MGSSFSIYNDTDDKIWVWQGPNTQAIIWPITAVITVASLGVATGAALSAGAAAAAGSTGKMFDSW